MLCECGQNFVTTFLKCIKAFQESIKFHLLCIGDEKFNMNNLIKFVKCQVSSVCFCVFCVCVCDFVDIVTCNKVWVFETIFVTIVNNSTGPLLRYLRIRGSKPGASAPCIRLMQTARTNPVAVVSGATHNYSASVAPPTDLHHIGCSLLNEIK